MGWGELLGIGPGACKRTLYVHTSLMLGDMYMFVDMSTWSALVYIMDMPCTWRILDYTEERDFHWVQLCTLFPCVKILWSCPMFCVHGWRLLQQHNLIMDVWSFWLPYSSKSAMFRLVVQWHDSPRSSHVPGSKLPLFPYIIGDGDQPNSRGLCTHYKDSLLKVGWPPNTRSLDPDSLLKVGWPSPIQGV